MEKSKYNIEKERGNEILIYNTYTGAVISLEDENVTYYKNGEYEKIPETEQLLDFGILVESLDQEMKEIDERKTKYIDSSTQLYLTILPTTLCNLRCVYCFESIRNITMTEDVVCDMIDFIKRTLIENNYKELNVNWFGGEPLLYPQLLKKVYNRIHDLTMEMGIHLSNSIITNGTFLSSDNIKFLKEMENLTYIQITLDGCKEVHDKRRPLIGSSSYTMIMENLDLCVKEELPISIRINVDKDNVEHIAQLINELGNHKDFKEKLNVYFGRVVGSQASYTSYEFSKIRSKCYKILKEYGFTHAVANYIPTSTAIQCAGLAKHSLVIDANGDLYTCWEVVGDPEYKIGTIYEGINQVDWKLKCNEKEECLKCKVYPICHSGCPKHYNDPLKNNCMYTPELLIDDIERLIVDD